MSAAVSVPATDPVELRAEIKRLVVVELSLEYGDPATIEDDAPLFDGSLGLDSIDALQLAVAIEEKLGVRIPDGAEARSILHSVRTIAEYVGKAVALCPS
jgi:acyl carrier protein